LVELLIAIGLLGVLVGFLIFTLNPFTQLQKAKDTKKQSDIKQIQTAADTYYNDINCYPLQLTSTYLNQNYIKNIPTDPDGGSYIYVVDDRVSCPQWNVIFVKLNKSLVTSVNCPLEQLSNCLPTNYSSLGYNYCSVSGQVDCSFINGFSLPIVTPTSGPTSTNTPTPDATSTNTPTPGPTNTPTITPSTSPTPPPFTCTGTVYAKPLGSQNCNSISPVTQCDFAGGSLTCYQNRSGNTCIEPICTSYQ